MTLAAVYLGAGYWVARYYHVTEYIDTYVFVWFLAFQTLAVFLYGSVFIAIGAACTDLRETQTLITPVMLLASVPVWFLNALIHDPNGSLITAMSFFPPATPMLMVARMAVPPGVPWWQPWVGIVGVLLMTLVCVYAAGRIFRVGLLMQGKGAKVGELVRWVIRG
jgi:ABC-type Na+ efflux pump permease subunit